MGSETATAEEPTPSVGKNASVVFRDIPFAPHRATFDRQIHLEAYPELQDQVDRFWNIAREVARPKAMYLETYVESAGSLGRLQSDESEDTAGGHTSTVEIAGRIFASSVLANQLGNVPRVFPYLITCGRELDDLGREIANLRPHDDPQKGRLGGRESDGHVDDRADLRPHDGGQSGPRRHGDRYLRPHDGVHDDGGDGHTTSHDAAAADVLVSFDPMLVDLWLSTFKMMALNRASRVLAEHIKETYGIAVLSTINPGSGNVNVWPVDQQRPLFDMLGNTVDLVGVRLTDSCLMVPDKSVSGIYFPSKIEYCNCQTCTRRHCPTRRAPYNSSV